MRRFSIFAAVFILSGLFSLNAQDLIILRDGSVIEAKVMEIHPAEIRYKRVDNLNGPMIIIPADRVLSVRYENGVVETINPSAGQGSSGGIGAPTPLQTILNALPAIPIAGNNLKFQFGGDTWIATVNGENFSKGTIELEDTEDGYILTLKQTHIWPGAVGAAAGRVAGKIPGGAAAGGALSAAGSVAGALGEVEAAGPEIVLEYKAGPPAKLSFVRSAMGERSPSASGEGAKTASARNNWISGNVSAAYNIHAGFGLDIGARYERMLGPKVSLGANFYWFLPLFGYSKTDFDSIGYTDGNGDWVSEPSDKDNNGLANTLGIDASFRFYPWGRTFFFGTALGFYAGNNIYNHFNSQNVKFRGLEITVETGWKIDVGKEGGFFLQPGIAVTFMTGRETVISGWDVGSSYNNISGYGKAYLGMGGAF